MTAVVFQMQAITADTVIAYITHETNPKIICVKPAQSEATWCPVFLNIFVSLPQFPIFCTIHVQVVH